MKYTTILIAVVLLFSCSENSEKTNLIEDVNDEIVEAIAVNEVDTVAIEQEILSNFAEPYSYFDDSLQKEVDAIHYNAIIDCKLNFNGDEWLDYFVIDGFGGGVSAGYFYDGKTGDLIKGQKDDYYIASGPARDIRTQLIDVDLADNQQELVVVTGGGGAGSLYYFCDIYRYEADSNVYKNIFFKNISAVNWDIEEAPHLVNYIDLFYSDSLFVGHFMVQKGAEYETEEYNPLAIKPVSPSQQYHYVYESYFDEFRIDRVTSLGQDVDGETVNELERLNDWSVWEEDMDELLDLVYVTGARLEEQMKEGLLTITDDDYYLNFTASDDGRVNLVTYTFPSGGTAGTIHHPILQWEKTDGSYATQAFYPKDEASEYLSWEANFYDIQKLPSYEKDLYVLVGTQKGSSSHFTAYAMVIELQGDSLILDYPAFDDAYSVLVFGDDIGDTEQFCIACMDYDATNNTLIVEEMGESDDLFMMKNSNNPSEKDIDRKGIVVWEFKAGKFVLQE